MEQIIIWNLRGIFAIVPFGMTQKLWERANGRIQALPTQAWGLDANGKIYSAQCLVLPGASSETPAQTFSNGCAFFLALQKRYLHLHEAQKPLTGIDPFVQENLR